MPDSQNLGMQRLTLKGKRTFSRAVYTVSQDRMADAAHMNTNLMSSSRFQLTLNISIISKSLQDSVVGDRRTP